jgi:hypothetical protein
MIISAAIEHARASDTRRILFFPYPPGSRPGSKFAGRGPSAAKFNTKNFRAGVNARGQTLEVF